VITCRPSADILRCRPPIEIRRPNSNPNRNRDFRLFELGVNVFFPHVRTSVVCVQCDMPRCRHNAVRQGVLAMFTLHLSASVNRVDRKNYRYFKRFLNRKLFQVRLVDKTWHIVV